MNADLSFEELQMQDIEHVKSYEDARRLPLSTEAKELLVKVKALNRSEEYVFPVRRGTYTDKLIRAVAFSKGIPTYDENGIRNPELAGIHPHSLRVGIAGSLYHRTKNRKAVQYAFRVFSTVQKPQKTVHSKEYLPLPNGSHQKNSGYSAGFL